MTNAEKFKTAEERYTAFKKYCSTHGCGMYKAGRPKCPLDKNPLIDGSDCKFHWLELEYEEPEPELKPCPFCGGEAHLWHHTFVEHWAVQCGNTRCAISPITNLESTQEAAIEDWNRRAK